jgi:SAM-dependent methyltransferase
VTLPAGLGAPSAWLLDHLDRLTPGGRILDVACGRGRHALHLARQGFRVDAVDRDADAIAELREVAASEQLTLSCRVLDLESEPPPSLGHHLFDGIVVFRYLHRPLFPALIAALAPGGFLIYETFTTAQALRGRPTNPRFLLEPGELVTLVAPLVILESRESDVNGQAVASVLATRPR